MVTALAFIFVLGILVFIHELGHFLVAKRIGIRVEKFSLGFPPNIVSKKVGETTYCIGIIPLGGFVKMAGESPEEEATGANDEFMSKTVGQRAAVIIAGPFMNYLLAIVLMIGIFYFGGKPIFDPERVLVGEVVKDGPAAGAGLVEGDEIIAIDDKPVNNFDSMRVLVNAKVAEPVQITWLRNSDTLSKSIVTKIDPQPNMQGGVDSVGIIGVSQKIVRYESYGLATSVSEGFATAHVIVWETLKFIKKLVSGDVSPNMIGGPVFIAQQSGKEAKKGASSLFFFMALLSVNLAVLNVLPIPVLDGGHLVFLGIEAIKGSPLSMKARGLAQQIGMVVLLGLIVIVTYNDIKRFLTGM
ncbi:MAG: RIP metalloprotease RseP [candidate division Zixibacteria bacterium]|nr:RIP metalloprotease RseP [candidate division Zixibacteria bacterium]